MNEKLRGPAKRLHQQLKKLLDPLDRLKRFDISRHFKFCSDCRRLVEPDRINWASPTCHKCMP